MLPSLREVIERGTGQISKIVRFARPRFARPGRTDLSPFYPAETQTRVFHWVFSSIYDEQQML
jgi:hypothetical protein